MPELSASGPNAEQITYWNEQAGPQWVALQALLDGQLGVFGERVMARAELRPGLRVLDIGCGCGETSLELARRVAPGGTVVGVDVSAPMLEQAVKRARAAGVAARFELADAQAHAFAPASFDLLFSRFGVMFFADPVAAFTNLARALRPGGRLAFVCWQSLRENPWAGLPVEVALRYLPPPPPPAPGAPGPFAFADPDYLRGILQRAGFTAIELEPLRLTLALGGGVGLDETVEFVLVIGPVSSLIRDANDPAATPRIAAGLREALAPYVTAEGVRMESACWIATASRP
jgi:SAM-dependent methyltransferase